MNSSNDASTTTTSSPSKSPSSAAITSKKKNKSNNVATEVNDAMRAFPAYNDGSIFVVMQFFTKLQDRLMASDFARFKELIGELNVDEATLTPEERCQQIDGTRTKIKDLLFMYGQDLVDEWPNFERSATAMTKGANIFHS